MELAMNGVAEKLHRCIQNGSDTQYFGYPVMCALTATHLRECGCRNAALVKHKITLLHKVSQKSELPRACQKSTVPNKRKWRAICFGVYWSRLVPSCLSQKSVSASACSMSRGSGPDLNCVSCKFFIVEQ
jgi:hypothetical protein